MLFSIIFYFYIILTFLDINVTLFSQNQPLNLKDTPKTNQMQNTKTYTNVIVSTDNEPESKGHPQKQPNTQSTWIDQTGLLVSLLFVF